MFCFRMGLCRSGKVKTPDTYDKLPNLDRKRMRVHFWVPAKTPGARIAVFNMMDVLREEIGNEMLPWEITCSTSLPHHDTDVLVCYKAVPPDEILPGRPVRVLLFCDQLECFWGEMKHFDAVVVHSSFALAQLVASRHAQVWFIEECEDVDEIETGSEHLAQCPPSNRPPLLVWHGHRHTMDRLYAMRPMLEQFAGEREVRLRLISNHQDGNEQWGPLTVERVAYTEENFAAQVSEARFGIAPARNHRMKHCLFKPSSRLRRLFALGVPAIGEGGSPAVKEFCRELPAPHPFASSLKEWESLLLYYWDNPEALDTLALVGHEHVVRRFAMYHYARNWIQFLDQSNSFKTNSN